MGAPSNSTVRAVLFERCRGAGLVSIGSDIDIESVIVRDIEASATGHGLGVLIAEDYGATTMGTHIPGSGAVRWSRVERTHLMGIGAIGSTATIEGVAVDATRVAGMLAGDGILIIGGAVPAVVDVRDVFVRDSARAGLANFGGDVSVAESQFECNEIDLMGEVVDAQPFVLEDLGGNSCGCEGETWACRVLTTMAEAPPPLEP
jgi:hypothetical protein